MKFLKMVLYIFLGFIALMGFAVWYSQTPEGKARNEAIRAKEHVDSIETVTKKTEIQQGTTLLIDETFDGKGLLNLPVVNQENNKFFFEEGIYKVCLGGWAGEYFFGIGKELNNFITEVHCDVGGAGICGIALAMPLEREVNKRPANVHFVKTTDGWIISEIPAKGITHTYENGSRWLKGLTKMKVGSVLRVIKKKEK